MNDQISTAEVDIDLFFFLLDGEPTNLSQAEEMALDAFLAEFGS